MTLQGLKALPSSLHSKVAPASFELNTNLALRLLRCLRGPLSIVTSGLDAVLGARVVGAAVLGLVAEAVAVGVGLDHRGDVEAVGR